MPASISKHAFLAGFVCRTRGWLEHHAAATSVSAGDEWRFYFGNEIGQLARSTLGSGLLLPRTPTEHAVARSLEALQDPGSTLLFEASFTWDAFVARADALRRHADGWDLIEVKSGKSPDGEPPKDEYIDDIAFTAFVAKSSGLAIARTILMLVNRDYRLDGSAPMFVELDVTTHALARADQFARASASIAAAASASEKPTASLVFECKDCPHFATECIGAGIDDHIFVLPRLSETRFNELRKYERIANLPIDTKLTDPQKRIAGVCRAGQPLIEPAGLTILHDVIWPAHYLDFEAVMPPLPWFPLTAPYEATPFQYALDVCGDLSEEPIHFEYLAAIEGDWRRELIEHLLQQLGSTGSIVVYSSYEKTRLNALAVLFPDLKPRIDAVVARLFDLERVFKHGYCHPGFGGRTSIKEVLPVMVNGLSYASLDIGNGDDAMAIFALMRVGKYPPETHAKHCENLLKYCGLDTRAMVQLHRAVVQLIN
ncbi:MAG TPA: DUF2779 domain-containing protein [Planctomycetota bacterium]|nr:DUF2779 domain-containing protein [Planctomycetota bacterium]